MPSPQDIRRVRKLIHGVRRRLIPPTFETAVMVLADIREKFAGRYSAEHDLRWLQAELGVAENDENVVRVVTTRLHLPEITELFDVFCDLEKVLEEESAVADEDVAAVVYGILSDHSVRNVAQIVVCWQLRPMSDDDA